MFLQSALLRTIPFCSRFLRQASFMANNLLPRIVSSVELDPSDAKWVTLKQIHWLDQEGNKVG